MYLAPLNYDRFFRKVFSDEKITRRFLEDFLGMEIESVEFLKDRHHITDDATYVEFDFRCKIKDNYVIIDMQQWYKMDVVQRFFIYHAINTGLQLEKLPLRSIGLDRETRKLKKVKDYRTLDPVITLIWMVQDTLGFEEDYIKYSMSPEIVMEFINNEKLWKNEDIVKILKEREKVLEVVRNETKELDFIPKNKLIFMLQKNIVKNRKMLQYERWFEFAEKTRNRENREEDFREYAEDEIFSEMIRRLNQSILNEEDIEYIKDEEEFLEKWMGAEDIFYEIGERDGVKKGKKEGKAEGLTEGKAEGRKETAIKMIKKGFDVGDIMDITELSEEEIKWIKRKLI